MSRDTAQRRNSRRATAASGHAGRSMIARNGSDKADGPRSNDFYRKHPPHNSTHDFSPVLINGVWVEDKVAWAVSPTRASFSRRGLQRLPRLKYHRVPIAPHMNSPSPRRRGEGEASAQWASGSGRSWKCTAMGFMPLPPSCIHGARSPLEVHSPRPFQPAFGSSIRPSRPLA